MDKTILKKFAVESRKDLMEKIKNKINTFFIDEDFKKDQKGEIYILSNEKHSLSLTNEEYQKRELLIKRIKELSLEQVIEEAAYTWFNRIIAIRYMEINDYLPLTKDNQSLGIRVLSSKDNTPDPEILKFTNLMNPDLDINFKKEKYVELKDDNEKFKYILLLVCKKLGRVIPQVFDGITDYIDILIPDNLLNDTGFITKIINEVPEENYHQVEIIGWLYQFYISEKKEIVFKNLRKNIKIDENAIPAATQIFTPDMIVRYMVENTLGKFWVEQSDNPDLINKWKYYIKDDVFFKKSKKNIEEISFIDPCCGSGHILVYAFEVFQQIYESLGYNKQEIPELILKNNLYGIDIDERATQLSILAVLLKAREFDKNIFNKDSICNINIINVIAFDDSCKKLIEYINSIKCKEDMYKLENNYRYAKELGTLINPIDNDYDELLNEIKKENTIFGMELKEKILPIIKLNKFLYKKFDIVVTNPPYIGSKGLSNVVRNYLSINYEEGKYDTYSSFMIRCINFANSDGYIGMMTPNTWMFINSYKKLRKIILNYNLVSLLHFSNKVFSDAAVIITSFIVRKSNIETSKFIDLQKYDYKQICENFHKYCFQNLYTINSNKFMKIPNNALTYWLSDKFINNLLTDKKIGDMIISDGQTKTGNNDKYLRMLWEIDNHKIGKDKKWNIHAKGGEFRKWYGNLDSIIDWSIEARDFYKKDRVARITPEYLWFKKGITWTLLSGNNNSFRLLPDYCTFNCVGPAVFIKNENNYNYILGLLNSKVAKEYITGFNPTLSLTIGDISNVPFIKNTLKMEEINENVEKCIDISKQDWDSFEISWDFKGHPLIKNMTGQYIRDLNEKPNFYLFSVFDDWKHKTEIRFNKLKENEEKLNEIFIDIYGLKDELTPEVEDKDITIRKADKEREIKSLISYAVGCMFGRYSLDKEGLIYAGGDFDEIYKKCKKTDGGWAGASLSNYKVLNDNGQEIDLSFEVDNDNIIPITDESYFDDDIVERFKTFISVAYGEKTLNENLDFIAETLGKKGTETSEDTIRRYFVNDFFNDHVKTYQKRPIYWLFDSSKKNGFKALVYMHRYNENLIPKVRLDYLHRMQTTYEKLLTDVNDKLTSELSMTDKKEAQKRQADLNAKLQEIKEYDEKIAHIANQRISIDLDDGVKVNYEKFKDILAKIK